MMKLSKKLIALTLISSTFINYSHAEPEVPANITTPDIVKTQAVGDLHFKDGYPSDETMSKVQRYMLIQRAVNVFTDGIQISSMQAIQTGLASMGAESNKVITISESFLDSNSLWLTGNTSTPYALFSVDVKDGPIVMDLKTPVLGFIDDAFFQYVGDIGVGNPKDAGKGAKYIVVHDSYKGKLPADHIVLKTPTYKHWVAFRYGDTKQIQQFKDTFKMYRLGEKSNNIKYMDISGVNMNTVHANNEDFYHELNEMIQYEPVTSGDPHYRGLLAKIGIEKGKPFNPQGEYLEALKEAAGIANVHARTEAFRPSNKEAYFYGDERNWFLPFGSTMSHEFIKDGKLYIDDRTAFHYVATGITPLMTMKFDGQGSSYLMTTTDDKGEALDGNEVYTVTLPPNPPMKRFWSFMAYDNQSRSILPTQQRSGGFDSQGDVVMNDDGSVTVTFSSTKPKGKSNWVQTLPNKGFFLLYRMYSPTMEWHDRKYMIGDLIKQ